jgi:hypothetical protein
MASKADINGLTLLLVVQGHLVYIKGNKKLGTLVDKLIDDVIVHTSKAIRDWPGNYSQKEFQMIENKILQWGEIIDQTTNDSSKLLILFSIISHCLADLYTLSKSNIKKKLLMPIYPVFDLLTDRIDPVGNHFRDYDSARELIHRLYKLFDLPSDLHN